jgi:minor extracellular serine protease Vpr
MANWYLKTIVRTAILFLSIIFMLPAFAQDVRDGYTLILEDPPVSNRFASRPLAQSLEAKNYSQQIEAKQRTLRADLATRNIQVTGSVSTLLNAVFVIASKDRLTELQSLPGVIGVRPLRRYHLKLNRATQLVDAPAAWNALGGIQNAGTGIKIAIIDSGIDQTHPAFLDSSLKMPAGYPICSGTNCAFTSNKVIVARSYVNLLAAGSDPTNPAADSRPDDYSPRDRSGHGTAVASCVAGNTASALVTFNGMAPKAYLGNYKVYGSPEVNDTSTDAIIIQAIEDAFKDGMDIASFSSGEPAFTGAMDTGAACGAASGVPCDPAAVAFENAAKGGMVVVSAAGNDGEDGNFYPTFNSIETPGDAPSVISVGATTNSHLFLETVNVPGSGVPSNLEGIPTQAGDAFIPQGATTAPLVDVATLGNDGYACAALPAGSLNGAFALIERGPATNGCTFGTKLTNATNAGAVGAIFYMYDSSPTISPGGLSASFAPAVLIANSDGLKLKTFLASSPRHAVTIEPSGVEQNDTADQNELVGFSSFGPSTGASLVKPDLVATGTSMYMAAQSYDPLGDVYSATGYISADGTSFATPLVAGAAALVKQQHPTFTSAQIKSALVNTASQDVTQDDSGDLVDVQWLGAGKLDTNAALGATVTSNPATISFGALTSGSLPKSQQLQITNTGSGSVTLTAAVAPTNQSSGASPALDKQSLTLAAGASGTITVTLAGTLPKAGEYSGAVTLNGSGVSLRIPYIYLVGDGVVANLIPLSGSGFDGTVGQPIGGISFKLVDNYGLPVANVPVTFTARNGGTFQNTDSATDAFGIAGTEAVLGTDPGTYSFIAVGGGQRASFSGTARVVGAIGATGVVNAASLDPAQPIAPGSYITIFGSALSDVTDIATSSTLPLAIDFVNVTFDVPSAKISAPGHLIYVSPTQVNVQVPWELQGQSSVQMKINVDYTSSNVVKVALADYSPALFEAGAGVVAALNGDNRVVTSTNPAHRGQTIQLFANGLGPVTNQPATGDPAGGTSLAQTKSPATVTIGGQQATVSFSGLAPGFAGLYQINATVPAGLSAGNQTISVSIGGKTSKTSGITVQ